MNHNDVSHALQAGRHLSAIGAAKVELDDLYAEQAQRYNNQRGQQVAALHQTIGRSFKAAEVHALLAIAEQLERVVTALDTEGAVL